MKRWPDFSIQSAVLVRAAIVLSPTVTLALFEGDTAWLQLSIMTISTFIGHERSGVAPSGVVLHALAILTVFAVLLLAQGHPILFPILTALFAMLSVRVTVAGTKLRSLGNFTFVPGLYLAMAAFEARHGPPNYGLARLLPLLFAGALPTVMLASVSHQGRRLEGTTWLRHILRLTTASEAGERNADWIPVLTVAAAVVFATGLVELTPIEHGQWVIWSAASVIGGDAAAVRSKWRARSVGALAGVPLGIGLAAIVPHNRIIFGASVIGSLLSLVAFRSYVVGFAVRCLLVVVAIGIAGGGTYGAAERVENVIVGGLIGFCFALGSSFAVSHVSNFPLVRSIIRAPSRIAALLRKQDRRGPDTDTVENKTRSEPDSKLSS